MAHRLLRQLPNSSMRKASMGKQQFKYLLVLDFEATCKENGNMEPQEIIEFPCVVVSTRDWNVKDVFHQYVKPRVNPKLTPFCTQLTGILQEMVDDEPYFPEVFSQFCEWIKDRKYFESENKSAFVTCGDWDLQVMLPEQCAVENLTLPQEFKQWINLKNIYSQTTFYYPRNLVDMLLRLNLSAMGRLHSGIDDVRNMIQIIQTLEERHQPLYKITGKYKEKGTTEKVSGTVVTS